MSFKFKRRVFLVYKDINSGKEKERRLIYRNVNENYESETTQKPQDTG